MQTRSFLLLGLLGIANPSLASSDLYDFGNIPSDHILWGPKGPPDSLATKAVKRQASSTSTLTPDPQCTNGPQSRACWSDGYSIATDFDAKWPTTGRTRTYDWTVSNAQCNPDGHGARDCMLVNNQYPGPVLEADWGDTISVTIHNNLQNNGTSIHWHGIRQLNSNSMDGTNGLTECPLAPGQSETFTFQATQFGTSWYHSHYSSQYGDGVVGPIVINGPAAANYDIDLGPVPVSDWYYVTAFQEDLLQNASAQATPPGPGPSPDAMLINGTNGVNGGTYQTITLTPGKLHRLRLINTAVDNAIRVSIDNHQMQVITSDFVPVHSIWTDSVMLGIGQRYDVIINANQTVGNYWMRAQVEQACQVNNNQVGQAIIRYDGAPNSQPTSSTTVTSSGCTEPGTLTPWVPNTVGSEDDFKSQARSLDVNLLVPNVSTNNQNIVTWGVNLTSIDVQWNDPTLEYVKTGNTSYPVTENLIELPNEGLWVYWIIQEVEGGPASVWHPMHLHGHDFYELGSGLGTFDFQTDPDNLVFDNPTRRDTALLPAGGWLVVAFPTDNPGAWLFHCHIAWHVSQGLGVQFLEAKSSINIPDSLTSQCSAWDSYASTALYQQEGSGL